MKNILLLLLFCFCCLNKARAQSIELNTYYKPCLGTTGKMPVKLTGNFNTGNSFFVQLRQHSAPEILAQVPAILNSDGQLEFVFSDSTLTTYKNLQVRVISTSPRVESYWNNNYQIHGKGTVHISSSEYSDTVNAGEQVRLKFTMVSSSDASLTLSTGTAIQLRYGYQLESISLRQPESVYIKSASNACGVMKTSGAVNVTFNPEPVRTIWAAPSKICEDSEVTIGFSSHGLILTPKSKFRIRFVQITNYGVAPQVVITPAELRNNLLVTRFPKSLNLSQQTRFYAQVLIDEPQIIGNDGKIELTVSPFPKVRPLTAYPSAEIGMGDRVEIGYGPDIFYGNLEANGVPYISERNGTNRNSMRLEKTTTFVVKSVVSACGTTVPSEPRQITIYVKPGIIPEPESYRQILCAGSATKIRFRSNTVFNSSTTFSVDFLSTDYSTLSIPASRVGDYLEFVIPQLDKKNGESIRYDNYRSLKIVTSNPRIESSWSSNYIIQSKPDMELDSRNVYNYEIPSKVFLGYRLYGNGAYTIEDEKGSVYIYNNNFENTWNTNIFVSENSNYKIKSISNSCFTNDNLPVAHFKIATNTKPILQLTPFKSDYACISDSIEVAFSNHGIFDANNVFKIQYSKGCCDFKDIATIAEGGIYKIKVPALSAAENHNISFRIASTSPAVYSDAYSLNMHKSPEVLLGATISDPGTESQPKQFLDDNPVFSVNTLGNPVLNVVYSINDIDTTIDSRYQMFSFTQLPNLEAGNLTKFVIKSLANACGSQKVDLTTYLKLLPYRITLDEDNYFYTRFCRGGAVNVPFRSGDPSNNPTFALQIATSGTGSFVTLASGETKNYFTTHLPADLAPGNYVIRVLSSDGIVSNTIPVYVSELPTATLSTTMPQPVILNPETPLEGKINFTGSGAWTVLFSNNQLNQYLNAPGGFAAYLNEEKEFSLKYVYNGCGYGTTSGKVDVRVVPKLYTSITKYEACEQQDFPFSYELKGDADLSNDYIRFQLLNLKNGTVVILDSTKIRKSDVVLSIPKLSPNNDYELQATVKSYGLISIITSTINTTLNVSLSGYAIINPGDRAALVLRNNKNKYDYINYELSDGMRGSIVSGGYSDNFIQVRPSHTTNYNLVSVSNGCGLGKVSGNAIVEVNPLSERSITATGLLPGKTTFCIGDTLQLAYTQKGNFTPANVMTVQISDTTGKIFRSLPTTGDLSPLKFTVPSDLLPGKRYYLRVIASDQGTYSGSYVFPVGVVRKPVARFASSIVYYRTNPEIVVLLEGGAPFNYRYASDESSFLRTAMSSVDTVHLQQTAPNMSYKLLEVSNECGIGTVSTPSTARVELQVITGGEDVIFSKATVAPNPTSDVAVIKFNNAANRKVELINLSGSIIYTKSGRFTEHRFNVSKVPPGLYVIRIEENDKTFAYKLIKQ